MQIIKYRWEKWRPVFTSSENGSLKKMQLFDKELSINIENKRCIGHIGSGKHVPCPHGASASGWYCASCMKADDFFMCVTCDGSYCKNEKRRSDCEKESYYIYLSAFGHILKVGISNQFRLTNRLVEQGADIAARIALVRDGMEARLLEQKIKKTLNIVDRVDGAKKHKIMFGDPNVATINILSAIGALKEKGFDLIDPEIYDLRRFYRLEKIDSVPEFVDISPGGELSGKVVAVKGNLIVFEKKGEFYAFNAHSLIGYGINFKQADN